MALKVPPEQRPAHPARTLAGLRADHAAHFVASGSDIRKAKLFNNDIYSPKFDIEIDQVCLADTDSQPSPSSYSSPCVTTEIFTGIRWICVYCQQSKGR